MDLANARSDERHASRTRHDAKPATLDRFWIHIANLVVIKRCKALNPRIFVVCLRYEYCCVSESGLRGFTVRTHCEVRGRMPGSCSITEWNTRCEAVDGAEGFEFMQRKQLRATKFNTHGSELLLVNYSTVVGSNGMFFLR